MLLFRVTGSFEWYNKGNVRQLAMNRTRGFVNLNKYKSGKAIKRLKAVPDKRGLKGQIQGKK